MAWISRDKDNSLFIYADKPTRRADIGVFAISAFVFSHDSIELPSNADEKLIGRHLNWEDEPVEIK